MEDSCERLSVCEGRGLRNIQTARIANCRWEASIGELLEIPNTSVRGSQVPFILGFNPPNRPTSWDEMARVTEYSWHGGTHTHTYTHTPSVIPPLLTHPFYFDSQISKQQLSQFQSLVYSFYSSAITGHQTNQKSKKVLQLWHTKSLAQLLFYYKSNGCLYRCL